MKMYLRYFVIGSLLLISSRSIMAQTPTDAIMMENGEICFGLTYTHDTWDEYWEGTLKRSNGNVGTLTRNTVMPMFALGIADRINVLAAMPWMSTSASGGQMKGVDGFQDFGLWLKGTVTESTLGSGVFNTFAVLGFSVPASDYLEDYMPFSLGLGAPELSGRGILNYQMNNGLYFRVSGAYHARGTATIERDFYYTDVPVYSDEVDVPNAWSYAATAGMWMLKNTLQVNVTYDGMNTIGGFDIRRQDVGFPSNNMEFTRIAGFAHYYFNAIPGLGVLAQYSTVLTGRNIGQSTAIMGGVTYQFGLWNKKADAEPEQMN